MEMFEDHLTAGDMLQSCVDEIRRLDAASQDISRELREIYTAAKGRGLNIRVLKKIARDSAKAEGDANDLRSYLAALGGAALSERLDKEGLDQILFGTDRYPSEMLDDLEGAECSASEF